MGKYLCNINIIGKDSFINTIDKSANMYVVKVFITGDIGRFGLASLTDEPRNWRNSRLRHAIRTSIYLL